MYQYQNLKMIPSCFGWYKYLSSGSKIEGHIYLWMYDIFQGEGKMFILV